MYTNVQIIVLHFDFLLTNANVVKNIVNNCKYFNKHL